LRRKKQKKRDGKEREKEGGKRKEKGESQIEIPKENPNYKKIIKKIRPVSLTLRFWRGAVV
jgi:hypothetical protein